MAAPMTNGRRQVRAFSVRCLLAAVLLAPLGACGGAGAPDDAPPVGSAPEVPDADRVFVNGEELPADLADAFRHAMQDGAPLPEDVGPDWAEVQEYLDRQRSWTGSNQERAAGDATAGDLTRNLLERHSSRPDAGRAIAAARAILDEDGAHERTVDAAEFLVMLAAPRVDADEHIVAGAKALLAYAPDYDGWPRVLSALSAHRLFGGTAIDEFFEELASEVEDPVMRATGRYYVAAGLIQAANGFAPGVIFTPTTAFRGETAETEATRQRALETAMGLSAGVEEEQFPGMFPGSPSARMTLAEAEADLVRSIRYGTVGGTLPEVIGTRLDGVEESLSDYRGRVVLLDFWATWCRPCIDVLPDLRTLVAEVPADRFALIAISVDDDVETVTRFMEDHPMPWTNWHVGPESDVLRLLSVHGYPTYVLVDADGRILARPMGWFRPPIPPNGLAGQVPEMPGNLPSLVNRAVAGLSPD